MRSSLLLKGCFAIIMALAGSGCMSSLHEYEAAGYATTRHDGPPIRTVPIQADARQEVVFGIVGNTRYVDDAYARLESQCQGEIIGINTRFSTKLGFFEHENDVHLQALCVID